MGSYFAAVRISPCCAVRSVYDDASLDSVIIGQVTASVGDEVGRSLTPTTLKENVMCSRWYLHRTEKGFGHFVGAQQSLVGCHRSPTYHLSKNVSSLTAGFQTLLSYFWCSLT